MRPRSLSPHRAPLDEGPHRGRVVRLAPARVRVMRLARVRLELVAKVAAFAAFAAIPAVAASAVTVAGCNGETATTALANDASDARSDVEAGGPAATAEDETADGACVTATHYDVLLESGTCADVPGAGGTWITSELFPDAPAGIRERSCAYRWTGPHPIDRGAIEHVPGASLATPVCGAAAQSFAVVTSSPGEFIDGLTAGGAAGCDVCARVQPRRAWVVLPGDAKLRGLLAVPYAKDATHTFTEGVGVQLGVLPPGVRAFVVDLPEPARGRTYALDQVTVF